MKYEDWIEFRKEEQRQCRHGFHVFINIEGDRWCKCGNYPNPHFTSPSTSSIDLVISPTLNS